MHFCISLKLGIVSGHPDGPRSLYPQRALRTRAEGSRALTWKDSVYREPSSLASCKALDLVHAFLAAQNLPDSAHGCSAMCTRKQARNVGLTLWP